jgi:hypothetical protein
VDGGGRLFLGDFDSAVVAASVAADASSSASAVDTASATAAIATAAAKDEEEEEGEDEEAEASTAPDIRAVVVFLATSSISPLLANPTLLLGC